jgi:hypothetical protein
MQRTQLDPRDAVRGLGIANIQLDALLSRDALIDFQRQHEDFLRRVEMDAVGTGHTAPHVDAPMPRPQDFQAEIRAAQLAIENDQLRVERALLLAQLAAKEAEIRELRNRLPSEADGDEFEELPHRKLAGLIRARSSFGTLRLGTPLIHPDDLAVEDE